MSSKTKSERLKRLLSHGFFAPELPPCFVSHDLAKYRKSVADRVDELPPDRRGRPAFHSFITEPLWFYFPRFGRDDRRHAVPNPISYLLLARTLAENYVALRTVAKRSTISASPPVFDWLGSRAIMRPNIDLRDDFRTDLSARCEEFVAADIRSFFHSIYTHSIPWAIHGKEWAKRNRDVSHFGNLIDLLCRNMQDGQTNGLPVGPDTSRLLAEVVASAVDQDLRARITLSNRDGSRYIDDYTISSSDGARGESLIAALRQAAAVFELELNNDKTAVHSTSERPSGGWKEAVTSHLLASFDGPGLQHFFYEVGRICAAHPDINVEKYALQHARLALVSATDWKRVQSVLIGAYRRNSTLVSLLVEIVLLRQVSHRDVDTQNLREFIEQRVSVLSEANRSGELVWLLFLAIRLGLRLSSTRVATLFESDNAMVALLLVYARSLGLIDGTISTAYWDRSLNESGLRGSLWLYAYEAIARGLVPGADDSFLREDDYLSDASKERTLFCAGGRIHFSIELAARSAGRQSATAEAPR